MRITSSLLSLLCLASVTHTFGSLCYVSQLEPITPYMPIGAFNAKTTTFSFGMSRTEGKNSYSSTGTAVPFLELNGTSLISDMYKGLAPRATGLTDDYFTTNGTRSLINKDGEDTPVDATLRFQDPNNSYLFTSYHAAVTQYLFSGLFIRGQAQFVDQSMNQKPNAIGLDADLARTQAFINDLDAFLKENNHPAINTSHRSVTIERAGLFLGWSGVVGLKNNFIEEISGSIMAGFTAAPSQFDHPLSPGFLVHGFTHGYSAQLALSAQAAAHCAVDLTLATTSHGRFNDSMHIVRDDTSKTTLYSGPPLLGMGIVQKDPGTIWVMETGLSANRFKGFYISGGYHFAYQEATKLTLSDNTVLLGANWEGVKLKDLPGKQNSRINSDPRLARWKNHSIYLRVGYTPSPHNRIIPHLDFTVHFPFLGMRSVCPSRIYTGSGQLSIRWTF